MRKYNLVLMGLMLIIVTSSMVLAFGFKDPSVPNIKPTVTTTSSSFNNNTINVNNSNYLQSLTPQQVANLFTSQFLYNMTNPAITYCDANFVPYTGATGSVNLGNNQYLTNWGFRYDYNTGSNSDEGLFLNRDFGGLFADSLQLTPWGMYMQGQSVASGNTWQLEWGNSSDFGSGLASPNLILKDTGKKTFIVLTNVSMNRNLSVNDTIFARMFVGNGTQLTGVCLANGTNCQSSGGNIFDQDLNTTSNVTFFNITARHIAFQNGTFTGLLTGNGTGLTGVCTTNRTGCYNYTTEAIAKGGSLYVNATGDQTVAGAKTFSGKVVVQDRFMGGVVTLSGTSITPSFDVTTGNVFIYTYTGSTTAGTINIGLTGTPANGQIITLIVTDQSSNVDSIDVFYLGLLSENFYSIGYNGAVGEKYIYLTDGGGYHYMGTQPAVVS